MSDLLNATLVQCQNQPFFFKYISANDAGSSGAHQSGFYMPRSAWPLFLDRPGQRGENLETVVQITWCDGTATTSRFEWYGRGTRSEYRLTRFGKGFEFLHDEHVGSLLVIVKVGDGRYFGAVLDRDDDIDGFMVSAGTNPSEAGNILGIANVTTSDELPLVSEAELVESFVSHTGSGFPTTGAMAEQARHIQRTCRPLNVSKDPDHALLDWESTEYELFRAIERNRYGRQVARPFSSVDTLVSFASSVLNRRKSRAGSSLELHLAYIFDKERLPYSHGKETEDRKKPDFIFPSVESYNADDYLLSKLVFLGVKTTCKDRWRQVLNEADRIKSKHLFTLQQGISSAQLHEMELAKLVLVIPEPYRLTFPQPYRNSILSLKQFISYVRETL
jgi:hypothetical protein